MRNLAVFILLFALIGTFVIIKSSAAATCDLTATTSDFSSKLASAAGGQTICLASGDYGNFRGAAKSSPGVTITAQQGATPVFSKLSFDTVASPAWLTFDNVTIEEAVISGPTHDVTFKNSHFTGYTQINPGASPNANNACGNCPAMNNNNIVFDGDNFDLSNCPDGSCLSMEGRVSFAMAGPTPAGVTIKNSIFQNNCADGVQFGSAGRGVTIGPGNEFRNLNQNLKAPSLISGTCGPHVDSIQFVGTSNPGPVITGNYFHNNSTGIASYDGSNQATITHNVITDVGQDDILAAGYITSSLIEHNTIRGDLLCGYTHDLTPCTAVIRNNIVDSITMVDAGGQPSVSDYNLCRVATCPGSHSLKATPTYTGGANPATYAGFALATGSAGKGVASDGKDIGVNITSSPGDGSKPGDFNGDNVVNIYDLGIFLSKWQATSNATAQDFNSDGVVNIYDLGIFLSYYGT